MQSIQAEIRSSVEPAAVVPVTTWRDFKVGGWEAFTLERQTYFSYKVVYLNKKDLTRFCDCMRASTFRATQIIFDQMQIPMRCDARLSGDHAAFSFLLSAE